MQALTIPSWLLWGADFPLFLCALWWRALTRHQWRYEFFKDSLGIHFILCVSSKSTRDFIRVVLGIWISRCLVWSISDLHVGDCSSSIHALSGFCRWKGYEGIYKFFTVSSVMSSVLHLSLLKSANLREFLSVVTYQCFPLLPVTVSL